MFLDGARRAERYMGGGAQVCKGVRGIKERTEVGQSELSANDILGGTTSAGGTTFVVCHLSSVLQLDVSILIGLVVPSLFDEAQAAVEANSCFVFRPHVQNLSLAFETRICVDCVEETFSVTPPSVVPMRGDNIYQDYLFAPIFLCCQSHATGYFDLFSSGIFALYQHHHVFGYITLDFLPRNIREPYPKHVYALLFDLRNSVDLDGVVIQERCICFVVCHLPSVLQLDVPICIDLFVPRLFDEAQAATKAPSCFVLRPHVQNLSPAVETRISVDCVKETFSVTAPSVAPMRGDEIN